MAVIDFSERLKSMEDACAMDSPTYRRVSNESLIPGILVEIYQSTANKDEIFFSARSCCEIVGLSRNWLNTAFTRPSTMRKLTRLGFGAEKRFVDVLVENSPGMTKGSLALTRSDFDALVDYAADLGRDRAIAINSTFLIMGLTSVAGLDGGDYAERFKTVYARIVAELEAKNVSK